MIRLSIASLAGFAAAVVAAWRLGGTLGVGVLAGFLLGAGFSGLTVLFERHVLLTNPSRALQAFVVCFLAKLAVLLSGALAFRFLEAAAARVDWRSFLVAFAAAVAVVLPIGLLDVLSILRRRGAGHVASPNR